MSENKSEQPVTVAMGGVRIIKPHQFDSNTPQTPGMQRMAAISRELAGSQGIWGGVTIVAPNVASGIRCYSVGIAELPIAHARRPPLGQVRARAGKLLDTMVVGVDDPNVVLTVYRDALVN